MDTELDDFALWAYSLGGVLGLGLSVAGSLLYPVEASQPMPQLASERKRIEFPFERQAYWMIKLANPNEASWRLLDGLELLVPGAYAYARMQSGIVKRWKNCKPTDMGKRVGVEIRVPVHAAWLVAEALDAIGVAFDAEPRNGAEFIEAIDMNRVAEYQRDGMRLSALALERGTLRMLDDWKPKPWQVAGVGIAQGRPWYVPHHAMGAGKSWTTLASIASSTPANASVVIVAPAEARRVWVKQTPLYTCWNVHRLVGPSLRAKNEEPLEAYAARMRTTGGRPVVVVGLEALPDLLDELLACIRPAVVVFDELHMLASRERWSVLPDGLGGKDFKPKLTAQGANPDSKVAGRLTRAVAAMHLSRQPDVMKRFGPTGTLLYRGTPNKAWAPFDLMAPNEFSGSYSNHAVHYCDGRQGDFGLVDEGESNADELKQRLTFFVHSVPREAVDAEMPERRVEVVRLEPEALDEAGTGYRAEEREVLRGRVAEGDDDDAWVLRERLAEIRQAEAASTKTGWVWSEARAALEEGLRVVVFTARIREVERLHTALLAKMKRAGLGDVPVWALHGESGDSVISEGLDAWGALTGPGLFIGTGQRFGQSSDDFKIAHLGLISMIPWVPGMLDQWAGRFGRLGGVASIVKLGVALGTYDERVASALGLRFDRVGRFFESAEARALGDKVRGLGDIEAARRKVLKMLEGK